MATGIAALVAFLAGIVVSIMAAQHWRQRKWLYAVPLAYALTGEVVLSLLQGRPVDWAAALFFGVIFLVLAALAKAMAHE